MSVSVAIVSKNSAAEAVSLVEINERVVEIKHYLKEMPGSKFMADRRNPLTGEAALMPQLSRREGSVGSFYRPLGQILLEKKIVTAEQLDEGLRAHWEKGLILGEVLMEMGFIKDEDLKSALNIQSSLAASLLENIAN